ncbi:hypothetical protein FD06_GL000349 [Apilactobacillus ozensis DSM 23829 = JCM 17196]|uniref:DUF1722 domain-containing protein n=2 Tax=Apilactobacillus ozensis TaxID=866801 RepID=A0A0R2AXN9_9LACO|nr:DUF1722 domain-containing protein [Apilactobacillus ozensis]KRM67987.1 hypothetical protein FD06_GL000349 [Apilactobacillus ozensis DSM 23829 = JCM 17196]
MSKSQQAYNRVRKLASNNNWNIEKQQYFDSLIKELEVKQPTIATLSTAYQHIWGYFKKICTDEEKGKYKQYLSNLKLDNDSLGPYLEHLTDKYDVKYLKKSRIIEEIKKQNE